MAQGFLVRREQNDGTISEREYELNGDVFVILRNRKTKFLLQIGEDPVAAVEAYERKMQPSVKIIETRLFDSHSGMYLLGIARPLNLYSGPMTNPVQQNELAKSYRRENQTIVDDIESCFDIASPSTSNFDVFGTQFEKIIYFSCVGVESLFNKVLADSGIDTDRTNTATFVKLKPLLRIDEYALSLVQYPWLPKLEPFFGWTDASPSTSLPWFDAYNSLKHSKATNQHRATMRNALSAAAAHYALSYAVFGNQMFTGYLSEQFFFHFERMPNWQIDELYFPPDEGGSWQARPIVI
jgi:hypothetical protein